MAIAAGLAAVDSALLGVALLTAVLFWPLRRVVAGRWSVRTPLDWFVGLLLLTLPVTLWVSIVPEKTLPQVLRLLVGIGLYYALVNWILLSGMSKLRLVANGLVGLGLALAAAAPFVVSWNALKLAFIPAELYSRFRLMVSDTVNPNVMAGALVLLLPLASGLLLFALRELAWWERLLSGLFLLCGVGMLFLTQSRGAWLALAAALSLLLVLRSRWGWLLILGFLAVGVFMALRLGPAQTASLLVSSPTLGGLEGRLEVWSRAVYMLQDFPFTGIGMGAFTEVADRLYPFFLYAPGTVEHAHNLFLQVGVDLGWLGLFAWLALLLGTLVCAWKSLRRSQKGGEPWRAGLSAGLLAAQIALIVHGLTDAVTWGMVRSAPLVWCIWGLAVAVFLTTGNSPQASGKGGWPDAPIVE